MTMTGTDRCRRTPSVRSAHADTVIRQKDGAIAIACGNPSAVPMAYRAKQEALDKKITIAQAYQKIQTLDCAVMKVDVKAVTRSPLGPQVKVGILGAGEELTGWIDPTDWTADK
jgi:diaminopimelate epimerase